MTKTLLLDPIWGPNFFVHRFYLYQQVGIIPSYHPMLFSGKLMNKLEKMAKKKLVSDLILVPLAQIWDPKIFLMLGIVASYHCIQFQGKLMNQACENSKKTSFVEILACISPNLVPKNILCRFYPYQMLNIIASYHCIQF